MGRRRSPPQQRAERALDREFYLKRYENERRRNPLAASELPDKAAFVLGHEELGLSIDAAAYPALRRLAIPQSGSVQSLNVAVAASIAMYEYQRQRKPGAN